jgi:aminoglycoside 6'-N-acetyltransferase I
MTEALQDVIFRFVHSGDRFGWLLMRKKLWDDTPHQEHTKEMEEALHNADHFPVFIAEQSEGNLIGFLEASLHHHEPHSNSEWVLYIEGWYVETLFRKQDIGRRLLVMAEDWGRSKGLTEVFSDAEVTNITSQKVHRALGFREIATNEEGIVFRKDL